MSRAMESPHEAEQTVLLERIIKNVDKCNEAVLEMNHNIKEFLATASSIQIAANLTDNYQANAVNYIKNLDGVPPPRASNMPSTAEPTE